MTTKNNNGSSNNNNLLSVCREDGWHVAQCGYRGHTVDRDEGHQHYHLGVGTTERDSVALPSSLHGLIPSYHDHHCSNAALC